MKRILALCIASAVLGAAAAVLWLDLPSVQPTSRAQESGRYAPQSPARGPTEVKRNPAAAASAPPTASVAAQDLLTPEERVNVAVYESANRSVVNITTRTVYPDRFFFLERQSEGEGSGTVIDQQGHILTNFHVVDGARDIQVTLYNGESFEAQMVGGDEPTDVAVLKIEAPADCQFPVSFGTSTGLRVGQRVYAIGNPFGLERTLSTGIISSLNRSLPRRRQGGTLKSIIQIDAAINPGNSGGPLLDTRARMIGMNTAIASKTGESAGVGFAIPVNTILRVVPELIRNGRVLRGDIGIAKVYRTEQGLLIASLVPGGAAEKAGLRGPQIIRRQKRQGPILYEYPTVDLRAADLIVAVDGRPIKQVDDFLEIIEAKRPGDQVSLTVIREGKQLQVPVTLEAEQ